MELTQEALMFVIYGSGAVILIMLSIIFIDRVLLRGR
ncbi:hypothetical protein POAN111098_09135 [Polynucleobacter antarcticus]